MTAAVQVASSVADEQVWLDARAAGVTASEIHQIASGSKRTWARLLDDKLNGSTFRGNRHTRRGHQREAFLIAHAAAMTGATLDATGWLYAAADEPRFLATPDAVTEVPSIDDPRPFGVEAKSHIHGYDLSKIPADHYDQMQWGMRVLGFDYWLYVIEAMGEDGEPTLDAPTYHWVQRDEKRLAALEAKAREFIEWRAAGAPVDDADLPDDFAEVVEPWLRAEANAKAAAAVAKTLRKPVEAMIAARPGADRSGWKPSHTAGSFTYSVTERIELDEAAWAAAEPDGYAEVVAARERIAAAEAAALALYSKPVKSTRLIPVHPKEPTP